MTLLLRLLLILIVLTITGATAWLDIDPNVYYEYNIEDGKVIILNTTDWTSTVILFYKIEGIAPIAELDIQASEGSGYVQVGFESNQLWEREKRDFTRCPGSCYTIRRDDTEVKVSCTETPAAAVFFTNIGSELPSRGLLMIEDHPGLNKVAKGGIKRADIGKHQAQLPNEDYYYSDAPIGNTSSSSCMAAPFSYTTSWLMYLGVGLLGR